MFVIILFINNINDINSDIKYSAFRILILTVKEGLDYKMKSYLNLIDIKHKKVKKKKEIFFSSYEHVFFYPSNVYRATYLFKEYSLSSIFFHQAEILLTVH